MTPLVAKLPKQTILVVDDEPAIREYICENLEVRGYGTLAAGSGLEALALFQRNIVNLVLLDIMMPHMDGFETCKRIRDTSNVPIIMLTALEEEQDKVQALDLGADDFISKPFGMGELLARFRAIFRRANSETVSPPPEELTYKHLRLNLDSGVVLMDGENIKLTKREYQLLAFMMQNMGKTLTHQEILNGVWGEESLTKPDYLRVYMGRLRNRIEPDPSQPQYLISEYGTGYRLGNY
ncbi:MAG: response regulator transcription factor [Chloroflexota bacterium]